MSRRIPIVYCIQSLNNEISRQSIDSYYKFRPKSWPNPIIIPEVESRANSLRSIFNSHKDPKDLFIFVDDIIFIENLDDQMFLDNQFGVLGMQMLKTKSLKLHNAGFRFITLDGILTYIPIRNKQTTVTKCDAITGCLMFIKHEVFQVYSSISNFGFNRWEEIIYFSEIKKLGFLTGIIPKSVMHMGSSTKNHSNLEFSSISWLIERKLWDKAAKIHFQDLKGIEDFNTVISKDLTSLLMSDRKKIIYGAGINTQAILNQFKDINVEVISSLKEEFDLTIHNQKIYDPYKIDFKDKIIIISPIGYDEEIKIFLKEYISGNEMIFIKETFENERKVLSI